MTVTPPLKSYLILFVSLTCGQVSDVSRAALIYYAKVFLVKIKDSDKT